MGGRGDGRRGYDRRDENWKGRGTGENVNSGGANVREQPNEQKEASSIPASSVPSSPPQNTPADVNDGGFIRQAGRNSRRNQSRQNQRQPNQRNRRGGFNNRRNDKPK